MALLTSSRARCLSFVLFLSLIALLHCRPHVRVVRQFVYPAERSQGLQMGAFGNPYGTGALNFGNTVAAPPTVYNNVYPNGDPLQPLPMQRMLQPMLQANGIQQDSMPYGTSGNGVQNTGIFNPVFPMQNQGVSYNQNTGPTVFQGQLDPSSNQASAYSLPVNRDLQLSTYIRPQYPTESAPIDERSILPSVYNKVLLDQVLTVSPSATEGPRSHANSQKNNGYSNYNENSFPDSHSSNVPITAAQPFSNQPTQPSYGAPAMSISRPQGNGASYTGTDEGNMLTVTDLSGLNLPAQLAVSANTPLTESPGNVGQLESTTESTLALSSVMEISTTHQLESSIDPTGRTETVVLVTVAPELLTETPSELAAQNLTLATVTPPSNTTTRIAETSSHSTTSYTMAPTSSMRTKEQMTRSKSGEISSPSPLPKSFFPALSGTMSVMATVTSTRPPSFLSTTAVPLSVARHELALILPVPRNDSASPSKMRVV